MRTERIGRTKKARRLRTRAAWICLFTGLITIAMAARLGEREIHAQSAAAPEAIPALNETRANSPIGSGAQDAATGQQAKTEGHEVVTDPKKKEIVDQSADLLKLASSLKAEVDKTSADTLSLAVIRQADQIEKLAHKMRSK